MPIHRFGTEEQKQEWLPRLASGQAWAGSDSPSPARERRRWHHHDRRPRRRRVGLQRRQTVHHQLRHRHHRARPVAAVTGTDAAGRKQISTIIVPSDTRGSRSDRPTTRSVGTRRTPIRCRSPTSASRARTFSARRAAATRTSCESWTRAASPSPHSPSASRRAVSTSACATPRSAAPSGGPSATTVGRVHHRANAGARVHGTDGLLRRSCPDAVG